MKEKGTSRGYEEEKERGTGERTGGRHTGSEGGGGEGEGGEKGRARSSGRRNSLRRSTIEGNRVKSNSYARTTRRNAREAGRGREYERDDEGVGKMQEKKNPNGKET